ncbi:MAG: hypothetical protein J0L76_05025 [Rhodobacterales bacterium]|nr:hypothetical protein [Rhodobacterales bacterium]
MTQGHPGLENRNVIKDLLRKSHDFAISSQNRHEPGLLRPEARAIWEKEPVYGAVQMAKQPSQPQQGGSSAPAPQQQGQQPGGLTQQGGQMGGQPIFKDWASI